MDVYNVCVHIHIRTLPLEGREDERLAHPEALPLQRVIKRIEGQVARQRHARRPLLLSLFIFLDEVEQLPLPRLRVHVVAIWCVCMSVCGWLVVVIQKKDYKDVRVSTTYIIYTYTQYLSIYITHVYSTHKITHSR